MTAFEYKVVPAPARGQKAKGIKGPDGRFANALERTMNEMAAEGWEFQRTETLPCEERQGLTSTTVTYRNVMVFRRARADDVSAFQPRVLERPGVMAELPPPAPIDPGPADDDPIIMADETPPKPASGLGALPVALLNRAKLGSGKKSDDSAEDVAAE